MSAGNDTAPPAIPGKAEPEKTHVAQDLAYDLRSGDPEPFDKIIANTFGALAVELAAEGRSGRMVCIHQGIYGECDLPDPSRGPRTVDISDYDIERFRPRFTSRFGRPIFF